MDDYNTKQREAIGLLGMDEAKRMGLLEPVRLNDDMDIVNQSGGDVEVSVSELRGNFPCAREDVLDCLKWARCGAVYEDARTGRKMIYVYVEALDRAIAYLETDPAEALAEDYAARMERTADIGYYEATLQVNQQRNDFLRGRATGLREAARMLRDKDSR